MHRQPGDGRVDYRIQAGVNTFREAVSAKFGPDEAKRLGGVFRDTPADAVAEVEKAEPTVDGDTAVFKTGEHENKIIRLKRVDGKWKVDRSALDKTSAEPKGLKEMKATGVALKEAAGDVAAEKYAKPQQALDAIDKKIREARKR